MACIPKVNERPNSVCSKMAKFGGPGLPGIWVVYNPLSQPKHLTNLILPTPNVQIAQWDSQARDFIATDTEAHCYDDPDQNKECEIAVKVNIPPLSYAMLRL